MVLVSTLRVHVYDVGSNGGSCASTPLSVALMAMKVFIVMVAR